MTRPLYQALANKVAARLNCERTGNAEWALRHRDDADKLVKDLLPSGSGFDNGTTLDWEKSSGAMLVFLTAFHHMDENGYYDGWTDHTVKVAGHLMYGLHLRIGGRDRNTIKDHIHEVFLAALEQPEPAQVAEVAS